LKELYQRFGILLNHQEALRLFKNKLFYFFVSLPTGRAILDKVGKLLLVRLGIIPQKEGEYHEVLFTELFGNKSLLECVFRLQVLFNTLWERDMREEARFLGEFIRKFGLEESPLDLGVRLTFDEQNGYQFYPAGSELLDEKLVDDVLGVLNKEELKGVKIAFTKGLKEFLESINDKDKLRNCIRDMQLACDETMKARFKDKNLGFKHLFEDERWQKIGLNKYQKQIFWSLNEFMDKKIKHDALSEVSREDAEFVIYMTGMFIRLVFLKEGE
jgi:hypothetical protein